MSEFDKNIISDDALRQLLQLKMLKDSEEEPITEQLINMEAKFALESPIFNIPSIPGEKEMIGKLKLSLGKSALTKWLFVTLIGAGASTAILYSSESAKENKSTNLTIIPIAAVDSNSQAASEINTTLEQATHQEKTTSDNPDYFRQFVPFDAPIQFGEDVAPVKSYKPEFSNKDTPILDNGSFIVSKNIPIIPNKLEFDSTFRGIKKLEVVGLFCSIDVIGEESNEIKFKGSIEIAGKFRKNKGSYALKYIKSGSTLKIIVEQKGNINIVGRDIRLEGNLRLNVPMKTEVLLDNRTGDINISGLKTSSCKAECFFGNINAENIESPVDFSSRSGKIVAKDIVGNFNCVAYYGNIDGSKIKGETKIESRSGNITVNSIEGNCDITAYYGKAEIESVNGNVNVNSNSGNVNISSVNGKTCRILGKYGNITLSNIQAELTVSARSGDVTLSSHTGNANIETVYGRQYINEITGNLNTVSRSGDISIIKCVGEMSIESVYGNINLNDCKGKMSINIRTGNVNGVKIELINSLTIQSQYGNVNMNLSNDISELSFDLNAARGKAQINKGDVNMNKENGNLSLTRGSIMVRSETAAGSQKFH